MCDVQVYCGESLLAHELGWQFMAMCMHGGHEQAETRVYRCTVVSELPQWVQVYCDARTGMGCNGPQMGTASTPLRLVVRKSSGSFAGCSWKHWFKPSCSWKLLCKFWQVLSFSEKVCAPTRREAIVFWSDK